MPLIAEDLTDREFGRLVVRGPAGRICGKLAWECLCSCGTVKRVLGQSLRKGTESCGCLQREIASVLRCVVKNQRFGRLTARRYVGNVRGYSVWRCRCRCGNVVDVRVTSLTGGHTTSCGCYRKERAVEACTTHGLSYTPEYVAFKARERLERKKRLDRQWTLEMEQALIAFQPECVVCAYAGALATDHVLPLSRGHGLRPGNAVRLCGSCNSGKHNKAPDDLDEDTRTKILTAAKAFAEHWAARN